MAKYKTHTKINLLFVLPLLLSMYLYFFHPTKGLAITFVCSFSLSTLFFSPDLDMANKIKLFSLRGILSFPFRLYARVFRHRGISHKPVLGSFTRILWLAGWLFLLSFLVDLSFLGKKNFFFLRYKEYFFMGLSGIILSDIFHIIVDKFSKNK